jgi:type IV secretory pathway TrbL component
LYDTFLQWGLTPAGTGIDARTFLQPGAVVDAGFVVAGGLYEMANRLSLWARTTQPFLVFGYSVAYWAVIVGFSAAALHLLMTMIEFHLSVLVATVLVPWGVLAPTAFFSEFSIGWVTGGLVRVLTSAAVVGIGYPLFQTYTATPATGGEPSTYSATVLALASLMFGLLAWTVPGRAASIAGRGISLALQGGTVMAGAAGGLRTMMLVTQSVRGMSTMVRGMRG